MTDTPPDRLAIDPASPHFDKAALERGVGVRFKDRERTDVEEYCVGEGWIRVAAGRAVDRRGKPLTLKLNGPVEVWWREPAEGAGDDQPDLAPGEPGVGEAHPS